MHTPLPTRDDNNTAAQPRSVRRPVDAPADEQASVCAAQRQARKGVPPGRRDRHVDGAAAQARDGACARGVRGRDGQDDVRRLLLRDDDAVVRRKGGLADAVGREGVWAVAVIGGRFGGHVVVVVVERGGGGGGAGGGGLRRDVGGVGWVEDGGRGLCGAGRGGDGGGGRRGPGRGAAVAEGADALVGCAVGGLGQRNGRGVLASLREDEFGLWGV